MKHTFTILFFLLVYGRTFAQVNVTLPQISAYKNDVVPVYVSINTTDSFSTLQFTVNWDPSVLTFLTVDSLTLSQGSYDNFGSNNSASGVCTFLWQDIKPVILPNSKQLFKITFKVIGAGGTQSPLSFSDTPTRIQSKSSKGTTLQVNRTDGKFTVLFNSSNSEPMNAPLQNTFLVGQNFPNPTNGLLDIPIEIKTTAEYQLKIVDAAGKIVETEKKILLKGNNKWQLPFERTGLFIYFVCPENGMCQNKKFIAN